MSNHESDFQIMTIMPEAIKAGDLILMGEMIANQMVADTDATIVYRLSGGWVNVQCDDGATSLNMARDRAIQVRRMKGGRK